MKPILYQSYYVKFQVNKWTHKQFKVFINFTSFLFNTFTYGFKLLMKFVRTQLSPIKASL